MKSGFRRVVVSASVSYIQPCGFHSSAFSSLSTRSMCNSSAAHSARTVMSSTPYSSKYSIAPMMEVTDRHFRTLSRLISKKAVLYTEMVVDRTLIHNHKLRDYALRVPPLPCPSFEQHPIVLQLGGSIPEELEAAARIAGRFGYTEVNLNCGCPSPKVAGKGCFGAALMRTPSVVAEATRRMAAVLPKGTPVTVKCRIGVDDDDSYEGLRQFIETVHNDGGVNHFIVHARKAILSGLSPAQNRSIPPLKYNYVHRLLKDFPQLSFTINGGFTAMESIQEQLEIGVHGVMVGRAVMNKPWHALCDVDQKIFGTSIPAEGITLTRRSVLRDYVAYAESEMEATGCSLRSVIKPLLNLFHGEPNGKKYRRVIDEGLQDPMLKLRDIVPRACSVLSDAVLDAPPPSVVAMHQEEVARLSSSPTHEHSENQQFSRQHCMNGGEYVATPMRSQTMLVATQDT